ncbi:helix-turn-helix domain-containing protein [Priestia koreensis]|uniref:helix-turn-helix domain-containing protein n=1 Tax=Priestia koreensis TaxID=284581 RepID=UPI00301626D8
MFSLTELGKRLKEAREQQNISLEDLQKLTKIQKRYLTGIEEGNYDLMPGKFYVRAFIKQYCEAVGLNADEIFEEYKADIPRSQNEDIPEQLSRVKTRKQEVTAKQPSSSKLLDLLPTIIVVVVIIGIAMLVWFFLQNHDTDKPSDNATPKTGAEIEQSDNASKDASAKSSATNTGTDDKKDKADKADKSEDKKKTDKKDDKKDEQKDDATKEEPAKDQTITEVQKSGKTATLQLQNADAFKVEITSSNDTWLGVQNATGKSYYNALLAKGTTQSFDFSQEKEVRFNIGFSPGVQVKVNGKPLALPFDPSQKVQQKITIQYQPTAAQ